MGELAGTRVAVLAAMTPELRPLVRRWRLERGPYRDVAVHRGRVGRHDVVAAVTCIGTAPAREVTQRVLSSFDVDHVVVVGVAGAVAPHLGIGELVVPEVAIDETTGHEVRPTPLHVNASGRLITTDVIYNDPGEVSRLAATGVVAVDMETAAIGAVAEEHGVPWSVFRAISDRAGDPGVDDDVVRLGGPDGSGDRRALAGYLATRPHALVKLARLGAGTRRAIATSTAHVDRALAGTASP